MLADVVGQDAGVRVLRRVAEGLCVTPLLIVGDEGVGRKFAFSQLAKEIMCSDTRQSGCTCIDCLQVDTWTHPDISAISAIPTKDEKVSMIERVRGLINEAFSYPAVSPYRLLFIDGADVLGPKVADVLLKTIEEPPAAARFFFLAEQETLVPRTIRSRCLTVRFRALPEGFVLTRVSERQSDSTKALVYARMGEGSVGRSTSLADGGKLVQRDSVFSMIEAGLRRDLPSIFSTLDTLKTELPLALRLIGQLTHDILMASHSPNSIIHLDISERVQTAGQRAGVSVWRKLSDGVRDLTDKSSNSSLNLQFHIQTMFVETFFGTV